MDGEDECGPYPMARYSSTATDRVSVEDVSYKEYPNLASSEHFDFADTKNSGNVIRHSPPRNKQYSLEQNRFKIFQRKELANRSNTNTRTVGQRWILLLRQG